MHEERDGRGSGTAGGDDNAIGRPLRDAAELAELPTHPGLCASCVHLRLLRSPRSTFVRCLLADRDRRFPRYPRLPVVACAGHQVSAASRGGGAGAVAEPAAGSAAGAPSTAAILHVTNGDSAARGLRESGVPGEVLPWRDVLHDGPVPPTETLEELSEIRARTLATFGWASYPDLRRDFGRRDATLRRWTTRRSAGGASDAGEHVELVLWFEHDLLDQLQLLQLLALFARGGTGGARLSLVEIDRFPGVEPFHGLGQLTGEQLRTLFPGRQPVVARQLALAAEVWPEVRAPAPLALAARAHGAMPELPFLAAALRRLCEEYPGTRDGLARSERQVLAAIAGGARDEAAVFQHTVTAEDVPWGDSSVFLRLATLRAAPVPAVVRGRAGGLELTPLGEAVLAGREDWVRASGGIDRWVGGVHLRGRQVAWRWDEAAGTVVECAR